jgi:ribonucleoside-diphosphate reductase alpha chain
MLDIAQSTKVSSSQRIESGIRLTENAMAVLKRRYLRKGPDGQPAETVEQMFHRVAYHVAAVEETWEGDVAGAGAAFYGLITTFRFMPNSPTFTGAGTPLGQLAACFVLPVSDDMGRDADGIFQTLRNAALIQQTGGGTGFSFSRLRPSGATVRSSGGQATGPVGFMRVFDVASGIVSQGGARRGANMAVLRADHPDIHEFISCKSSENAITNFNLSVGVTDDFMRAVEEDGTLDLVNPQDGEIWQTVRAREIFDEIVAGAHRNGEPGLLFLDAANRENPCPHMGDYEATNPCVVGSTWVITDEGPAQVDDVIGKSSCLLTNGRFHPTTAEGFFFTGKRDVLEIRTQRGFCITATANHPFRAVTRMTRYVVETEWQKARTLKTGDKVLLADHRDASWNGRGTWEQGYLLGLLVGDGTITHGKAILSVWGDGAGSQAIRDEVERIVADFPQRADFKGFMWIADRKEGRLTLQSIYELACAHGLSETFKGISPEIERTSEAFHRGFLRGLFDADGTVIGNHEKGNSIRLAQSNLSILEAVQRMLHRLGIVSTIYRERRLAGTTFLPDGKGGEREYPIKAQHELAISGDNMLCFADRVGFTDSEKASRLGERLGSYRRRLNRERFVDEIVSIEPCGKASVYDVHIPQVHAFDANGFYVHNCGEQYLLPYENCCLGSINLARHVSSANNGHPGLDWARLRETVQLAVRFLDDVIDANGYVPAVPQLKDAAQYTRRIGLGIMGLGDLMYHLDVRYGSDEAQELAAQVMEFIRYHAMRASVELARERGPFPAIEGSVYDPQAFRWTPPQPVVPYTRLQKWGRPSLDWEALVEGLHHYGIRNAAQTTVAPTGTIATVSGCEAYGCEPVFALAYVRHVNDNGKDMELRYTSPIFLHALEKAGLDREAQERILQKVALGGSCQDVEALPLNVRETFVVAADITAEEHVRMQAALQAFVDASISKTINFPASATPGDVARAFELAWKLGCKGLTVYVTGSREKVVLETEATRKAKEEAQSPAMAVTTSVRRPRPHVLKGVTYRKGTPLGTAYVTVNANGGDEPFEVFLTVGKAGSDTAAVAEALGRLVSLVLRIPSPLTATRRLKQVVTQLKGIGGGQPLGFGPDRVRSLPDGVAQVLAEHLGMIAPEGDGQTEQQLSLFPAGDLCPECGHAALVNEEGCRRCYSCGHSEC